MIWVERLVNSDMASSVFASFVYDWFFFFDFCYIQDQIMKYSIQVVDNVYMLKNVYISLDI